MVCRIRGTVTKDDGNATELSGSPIEPDASTTNASGSPSTDTLRIAPRPPGSEAAKTTPTTVSRA